MRVVISNRFSGVAKVSISVAIIIPLRARSVFDAMECVARVEKLIDIPRLTVTIADNSEPDIQKFLRARCCKSGVILIENNWSLVRDSKQSVVLLMLCATSGT
jgi:hypothetical protein